jgi:hypothetical protein
MERIKQIDIKWVSSLLFIIAGTMVALRLPMMKIAFPMFVVAHGILVYDFHKTHKNKPLIIQNIYFFIVNIIATYIWMIK